MLQRFPQPNSPFPSFPTRLTSHFPSLALRSAVASAAGLAACTVVRSLKLSVLRLIVVVSRLVLPHGCGKGLTVAPLASLLIPRLSVSAEPRIGAAASEITERFFASEIAQSDPTAREIDWAVEEVEAVYGTVYILLVLLAGTSTTEILRTNGTVVVHH